MGQSGATEARKALRQEVEAAHRHVQKAQSIAYGNLWHEPGLFWTRLALNKAQNLLIKQLVHRLKET
jgi:hypothetical protein